MTAQEFTMSVLSAYFAGQVTAVFLFGMILLLNLFLIVSLAIFKRKK